MPIKRVPVIHRFGIVSHSKRLELHERLAKKVIEEEGKLRPKTSPQRKNEFAIDEEFVTQYNEAENGSEGKDELHKRAEKIFNRAKRKAGLRENGIGSHVSLNQAWRDLSLLAQCNTRPLQEGALGSLYKSLTFSPISRSHVESLLELAHASIHWLTESNADQPYLRTGEVWLLKVAHLVFLRLYYHHLAGDIVGLHEERMALTDIVEAFEHQQDNYRPFPSSLLLVRIIIQISQRLKSGLDEELKVIVEKEIGHMMQKSTYFDPMELTGTREVTGQFEMNSLRESPQLSDAGFSDHSIFHDVTKKKSEERLLPSIPAIHDTSPTLWHALDSWRILTHTNQNMDGATNELVSCSTDLAIEPFLDAVMAIHVLAEICKLNHQTLEALQFIARRDVLSFNEENAEQKPKGLFTTHGSTGLSTRNLADSLDVGEMNFLSDFNVLGKEMETERKETSTPVPNFLEQLDAFLDPKPLGNDKTIGRKKEKNKRESCSRDEFMVAHDSSARKDVKTKVDECRESKVKGQTLLSTELADIPDVKGENVTKTLDDQFIDDDISEQGSYPGNSSSSGGSLADLSSLASDQPHIEKRAKTSRRRIRRKAREDRSEQFSSDENEGDFHEYEAEQFSYRNRNLNRESSLSIEMANERIDRSFSFSGHTITRPNSHTNASITRWPWELIVSYVRGMGEICIHGNKSLIQRDALMGCRGNEAGLLQLLKFQLPVEEDSNADWSWRVRHVTVHELMRVCQLPRDQPLKDGLRNAAWAALLSHHSLERDRRVLEAYKIARTEVNLDVIEDIRTQAPSNFSNSVFSRISTNLAIIHLNHLESDSPVKDEGTPRAQMKSSLKNKGQFMGQSPQRSTGSMGSKASPDAARVSLRNEIMIASTLERRLPPFGRRCWKDVQSVVEDQWRKELVEEYERIDKRKQKNMDEMVAEMRESLTLESLKERV
ncbi:transmembrane protein 232-like [Rhopilema esculentum]|uniref:transmembrane protein 232-like n=1 Tax=Rhopilema esculentum TaxID=499914 RepID=UPI0031E3815D|eukprot:gene3655-14896_t